MGTGERAILLAGMMGSGKSAVGRALATRLGWPFLDTDEMIAKRAGREIAEIFERDGEAAFRAFEREVLASLPSGRAVIALGGGAVVAAENRAVLRERGLLVWLDARPETLAARIGDDPGRPLLGGEGASSLERLRALSREREASYADCDVRVDTEGRSMEEVCDAVATAAREENVS